MDFTNRLLVLLVCLATLGPGLASVAVAQDDEATETARERFMEGVEYFDQSEFGKARVAFAQAYALKKHPDVLLNLGLSELRTDGYEVDAAAHLAEYLRQVPDSDKREQAQEALEEAKEKVVTVKVKVDSPVTAVLVDDEPYTGGSVPGPIFLDPGTHTIELRTEDHAKSNDLTADAGDERALEFFFDSGSKDEATATVAAASEPKKRTKKDKTSSADADGGRMPFFKWMSKRPLAIVLGGVFVSGAGTGAGFLFAAQNEYDNADVLEAGILARSELDAALADAYPDNPELQSFADQLAIQGPCGGGGNGPVAINDTDTRYAEWCEEYYDTTARGDDYQTISIVGFGVGGAALIAVPIYYLIDTRPNRKSARRDGLRPESAGRGSLHLAPIVGSGFSGLSVSGHF